jgi:hypothetical protein
VAESWLDAPDGATQDVASFIARTTCVNAWRGSR